MTVDIPHLDFKWDILHIDFNINNFYYHKFYKLLLNHLKPSRWQLIGLNAEKIFASLQLKHNQIWLYTYRPKAIGINDSIKMNLI